MKIYGISGLGADKSVFDFLTLDVALIPIDWITPHQKEGIEQYSKRLSTVIDVDADFCLIGVSFGGLIATEISKILNPKLTILISSAATKNELRPLFRIFGKTGLIRILPTKLFDPPRCIANYIFGAKNKIVLQEILDDTDLSFAKWAVNALINWKNTEPLNSVIKINGTHDKLIPPRGNTAMELIDKGEHFMIVDRAEEVSALINDRIKRAILTHTNT